MAKTQDKKKEDKKKPAKSLKEKRAAKKEKKGKQIYLSLKCDITLHLKPHLLEDLKGRLVLLSFLIVLSNNLVY